MNTPNDDDDKLATPSFDLTTEAGLNEALRILKDRKWWVMAALANPALAGPILAIQALDKGLDLIRDSKSTIQKQREATIEIIKAGKDNNASSLEVTLDQRAGIDLGSELQGVSLNFAAGTEGKMTIKVQYK